MLTAEEFQTQKIFDIFMKEKVFSNKKIVNPTYFANLIGIFKLIFTLIIETISFNLFFFFFLSI
jgi:hypothetical protein